VLLEQIPSLWEPLRVRCSIFCCAGDEFSCFCAIMGCSFPSFFFRVFSKRPASGQPPFCSGRCWSPAIFVCGTKAFPLTSLFFPDRTPLAHLSRRAFPNWTRPQVGRAIPTPIPFKSFRILPSPKYSELQGFLLLFAFCAGSTDTLLSTAAT